jgi:tetratricopeptide (TPR) repeat protein
MGASFVLQGSVMTAGGEVRVNARLSNVETEADIWTEDFDAVAGDVMKLVPTITERVVGALDIPLTGGERKSLTRVPTEDTGAYDLYIKGRELFSRRGKENTEEAIEAMEEAVRRDPEFAAAHESLAEAYSDMYTYYDGAETWLDKIVDAANKALSIDPGLVDALFSIGMVHFHRKEHAEAKKTFEDIIRERPRYYEAHRWLGIVADVTGDYDAALDHYHKSAEINPCSVEPWLYINMTHRRMGDLTAANQAAKRFLEVGLKTLQIIPDDPVTLSRFCVIYTLFGDRDKAYDALGRILESDPQDGLVLYNCAATYALLDDAEKSLECLRKALDRGYKNIRDWLEGDPDFDDIRTTAEFKDLLAEFDSQHKAGS